MLYFLNKNGYFLATNLDIKNELADCTFYPSEEAGLKAYNERAWDDEEDHLQFEPPFLYEQNGELYMRDLNSESFRLCDTAKAEFSNKHDRAFTPADFLSEWNM